MRYFEHGPAFLFWRQTTILLNKTKWTLHVPVCWPSPSVCPAALQAPCCSSLAPAEVMTAVLAQPAAETTAPPPSRSQIASDVPSPPAELSLSCSLAPSPNKDSEWLRKVQVFKHRAYEKCVCVYIYAKLWGTNLSWSLFLHFHTHLLAALQSWFDPCHFGNLLLQLSPQFLHFKLLLLQLRWQPNNITYIYSTLHCYIDISMFF